MLDHRYRHHTERIVSREHGGISTGRCFGEPRAFGSVGVGHVPHEIAAAAQALDRIAAALAARTPDARIEEVEFSPVIPDPDKILCIGLNYKTHIEETGHKDRDYPTIFPRFANCQVGHNQPIVKPRESDKLDYEG